MLKTIWVVSDGAGLEPEQVGCRVLVLHQSVYCLVIAIKIEKNPKVSCAWGRNEI